MPVDAAAAAGTRAPGAPGPRRRSRSRRTGSWRRRFVTSLGIPVAPFAAVDGAGRLRGAVAERRRAGHPEDAPPRLRRQGAGPHPRGERHRRRLRRRSAARRRCSKASSPSRARSRCSLVRSLDGEIALLRHPAQPPRGRHPAHLDGAGAASRPRTRRAPARSPASSPTRSTTSACSAVEMFYMGEARRAAAGQRDRAARAQLRPLDDRRLRRRASSRTTSAPSPAGRSARRRAIPTPDDQSDRRRRRRLAAAGRRARRLPAPLRQARGPPGPQDGPRQPAVTPSATGR